MKTYNIVVRCVLFCSQILCYNLTLAQSTTTITYDAIGNRISKKMQGSSLNPLVTANPQAVNPNQPAALAASGCPGTVQWSSGQQGANITVNPSVTTQYSASCVVAGCTSGISKTTVDVIQCVAEEVTTSVSAASVQYGQTVTLSAYGCTGTVQWSTGQVGNVTLVQVYGPATNFTATCNKQYCPNSGSSVVSVAGTSSCATGAVLVSAQAGNWNTPSTWACGRVPTLSDEVYILHVVTVDGIVGNAKSLVLGGGYIINQNGGFINLQPF